VTARRAFEACASELHREHVADTLIDSLQLMTHKPAPALLARYPLGIRRRFLQFRRGNTLIGIWWRPPGTYEVKIATNGRSNWVGIWTDAPRDERAANEPEVMMRAALAAAERASAGAGLNIGMDLYNVDAEQSPRFGVPGSIDDD
jgi:hypothetical protein